MSDDAFEFAEECAAAPAAAPPTPSPTPAAPAPSTRLLADLDVAAAESALRESLALAFPPVADPPAPAVPPPAIAPQLSPPGVRSGSFSRPARPRGELPDNETLVRNLFTSTPAPPPPPTGRMPPTPVAATSAMAHACSARLAQLLAPHARVGPELACLPRAEQRRVVRARARALDALFAAQTSYVSALEMLYQAFAEPLMSGESGAEATAEELEAMGLITARSALEAARAWLDALAAAAAAAPGPGHASLAPAAAELVASPAVRLHRQLCSAFRGAIDAYGQCLNGQGFAAFVVGRQHAGYGSLPTLLRAAIDAMPAYDLLIDAVRAATWASHPDAESDFGRIGRASASLGDALSRAREELQAQERRGSGAAFAVAPAPSDESGDESDGALSQPWCDVAAETVSPLPVKPQLPPAVLLLEPQRPSPPSSLSLPHVQHHTQRAPRQCARLPLGREVAETEMATMSLEELREMRARLEKSFADVEKRLRGALEKRELARGEKEDTGHEVESLLAILRKESSNKSFPMLGRKRS